jgi:hypothetical protein
MTIQVSQQLEVALLDEANRRGVTLEKVVLDALQDRFLSKPLPVEPLDEWERNLFGAAVDCGVSVPNLALSSDGLYE